MNGRYHSPGVGYLALLQAIFERAWTDLDSPDDEIVQDARDFLGSDGAAEFLADHLGLDPAYYRQWIDSQLAGWPRPTS